jgi:hypothetical protein
VASVIVQDFASGLDLLGHDPIAPADRAWWAETSAADEAMRAYYDALEDRDFDGWGWSSSGLAFPDDPEGGAA